MGPIFSLAYQIIALLAFAIIPVIAYNWLSKPFIGAFIEQTLVVNSTTPNKPDTWDLYAFTKDLEFGYQIDAIDGKSIRSTREMETVLAQYSIGDEVEVSLRTPDGEILTVPITLSRLPFLDQVYYLYVPFLIGIIYLLSGLWVFSMRHRDSTGRAFATFTTSVGLGLAALFDLYTTHRLSYLWTIALALAGGSLFNLALIFPEETRIGKYYPIVRFLGYIPVIIFGIAAIPILRSYEQPLLYTNLWRFEYIFLSLAILFFLGMIIFRLRGSSSPIVREQSRYILVGSAISFIPLCGWFILTVIWEVVFRSYILVFLAIFPVFTGYAILRYRLLKTDYLASRATLYGILTVITASAYALVSAGLGVLLGPGLAERNPLIFGAVIFGIAMLILPLRNWLQHNIDSLFSRGQSAYREKLQAFSRDLTQAMELNEIISLLRKYVSDTLSPTQHHIFIYDALTDHYIASRDSDGRSTTDLRFSASSPLVQSLGGRRNSVFLGEAQTIPTSLQNERARLALLGAQMFIPLPGRGRLTGWMAMGSRQSGEPYVDQDLHFLESLGDQAALAVERAQVVANLERRVHEMNVLARVSQGINVTVAFDDILELIYAQTNNVVPTIDFRVTLHDNFSNYLYHVFYLENDERFNQRENKPLPLGQGLEQEVVQSQRPLSTDDYERECRSRGVLPTAQGILAWVSVPLNAGAETIGVLSLGSRDPSITYTDEQINLLQSIADQAAGAIIKARLLQESERRTRQLTSLNEVARSLTSTLELDKLLSQILSSAESILNTEAGSLLLVDPQTDELVFKVVTGPVATQLLEKRLPPGAGLVGKSVQNRQPVIANDVRRTKEWFEKPDEQTGFNTQDLLAVPMQVKDRVIGVIEVINRKDGLPFTQDDQELLSAFTSQAAVAIENARLYTLTDQALAARVEELSVMQRIDRELNASLNVDRAIGITLNWAMRQSGANAGLVAVVEKEQARIVASQGYTNELSSLENGILPKDIPPILAAIVSGQPQRFDSTGPNKGRVLLEDTQLRLAVPIRRESETIGIIFLESKSTHPDVEEILAFLSRLSDHASIAIANARLYAEVEAANVAKSDFVSFVSHELKTPMTSIKGFTDLLLSSVVGPVNEPQHNFLSTIRSNIDRMVTLVSDLADVSRIEAGRLRLDFAAVPVIEIIEEVTRSVQAQVEERKQKLTIQVDPELPPAWGDRTRLIQILTNLASNAYKYSPQEGQIMICAEVAANQNDENGPPKVIHISVQDTGFGIAEAEQKKIFQKFFRSDDQAIRDAPGTGLGLNITKQLVEMQGGKIWFVSKLREGTTFHFTVPIAESA